MSKSKTVTVYAKVHWLNTNVTLNAGQSFTVSTEGQWSANPGIYRNTDAKGAPPDTIMHVYGAAKPGYALPGANESCLVGYIGDFEPHDIPPDGSTFSLACTTETKFKAPATGTLFLTINDDIKARYGNGYPDNTGSMSVTITVE